MAHKRGPLFTPLCLPAWPAVVCAHIPKPLVMVQTTWLMAQETFPSCDETSVKSQYISI